LNQTRFVLILSLLICIYSCVLLQEPQLTTENHFSGHQVSQSQSYLQKISQTQQYTPHEPIIISSDSDFVEFPGSGTNEDPYRIEGFNISSPNGNLIAISYTKSYFCIYNNYLNGLSTAWGGIVLRTVTHGTIENNLVSNHESQGIAISNSNKIIIANNTAFNGMNGIRLEMVSYNNLVVNNTVFNNKADGIWVGNLCKNNIIANNTIKENDLTGIYLGWDENLQYSGSDNNIIFNNIVYNNNYGIRLEHSDNNILADNTIVNNYWTGIDFILSNNCQLSNNIITNNGDRGIYFENSRNNTLLENSVINNNNAGITLYLTGNSKLGGNIIVNNSGDGIILASSRNNTITDNILVNNGLLIRGAQCSDLGECYEKNPTLEDFFQGIIQNNSVNGKELVYWQNIIDRTVPSGAGQVILVNCNAVTISNQRISDVSVGIFAISCPNLNINNNIISNTVRTGIEIDNSSNSIFFNNLISNGGNGITLYNSIKNILSKNTISGNYKAGITLDECKDCNISQNGINDNRLTGIALYNSDNSTISYNHVSNGVSGISLSNSLRNTLLENMISGNSEVGITLVECEDCTISKNFVFNNQFIGISLYNSRGHTLSANTISNNDGYGIFLSSNTNNIKIIRNDFIRNNPFGSSQACDDGNGQNNTFSHNFWEDWTNPDADSNGIVDEPYFIDGQAGNSDLHPQTLFIPLRRGTTFRFSSNIIFGTIMLLLILSALFVSIRKQKTK